ncbi:MAG: GNAT family N-acetyltransferase [Christensenellales bacterium]|jgi:GNAT superfamily N-acetyltransferase
MGSIRDRISIRRCLPGDEHELKKLWREVFRDTDEFIDAFFDVFCEPGIACVALYDDIIISAGYCLTGVLARGRKCSYIYAMATYPEYRGQGAAERIGRRLIDDAFAEGADVVATLPASLPLVGWYERKLGMTPTFRKGLPGAVFPEKWHRFSDMFGNLGSGSPEYLSAVAAPGIDLNDLIGFGWELTFE